MLDKTTIGEKRLVHTQRKNKFWRYLQLIFGLPEI